MNRQNESKADKPPRSAFMVASERMRTEDDIIRWAHNFGYDIRPDKTDKYWQTPFSNSHGGFFFWVLAVDLPIVDDQNLRILQEMIARISKLPKNEQKVALHSLGSYILSSKNYDNDKGIGIEKIADLETIGQIADQTKFHISNIRALFDCESVQRAADSEQKGNVMRNMYKTFSELGIEYYHRYSSGILDDVYQTATTPAYASKGRLALIALNKADWNGAFGDVDRILNELLRHGYHLIVCESSYDKEVASRIFHAGRVKGDERIAPKYDLLLLGGHGDPWSIEFGKFSGYDQATLDVYDFGKDGFTSGAWKSRFNADARIVLDSCSTGKDMKPIEGFRNIMSMIGVLADRPVFAPNSDTALGGFNFDDQGRVMSVNYDGANCREWLPGNKEITISRRNGQ